MKQSEFTIVLALEDRASYADGIMIKLKNAEPPVPVVVCGGGGGKRRISRRCCVCMCIVLRAGVRKRRERREHCRNELLIINT